MSVAFSIRRATEITDSKLKSVKNLLSDAWKDDVFTSTVTGGDSSLDGEFHGMVVTAGLRDGQVYFAENEDKEIIGVAVWYCPDQAHPLDSVERPAADLAIYLPKLRPEVREWWTNVYLPDCYRRFGEQLAPETRLASWHLQQLATAPEYQRQGVARALIDVVKNQAAENGRVLSAQIATKELNVEIFKKLGFEIVGEPLSFQGLNPESKYDLWACVMDPAVGRKELD